MNFAWVHGPLQWLLLLLAAPLAQGLLRWLRGLLTGQLGASPLQPYRDLWRLARKEVVISQRVASLALVAPLVHCAALAMAAGMVPLYSTVVLLTGAGDLILFLGLLLISRFALYLLAMDSASAFTGLGVGRSMAIHSVVEPTLLLILLALGLDMGSLRLEAIVASNVGQGWSLLWDPVSLTLSFALLVAILMDCGRMPFDSPTTHLELTMIDRAARSELSGPSLALFEWGEGLKLLLLHALLANLLLPLGVMTDSGDGAVMAFGIFVLRMMVLLTVVAFLGLVGPRFPLPDALKTAAVPKWLAIFAILYLLLVGGIE